MNKITYNIYGLQHDGTVSANVYFKNGDEDKYIPDAIKKTKMEFDDIDTAMKTVLCDLREVMDKIQKNTPDYLSLRREMDKLIQYLRSLSHLLYVYSMNDKIVMLDFKY